MVTSHGVAPLDALPWRQHGGCVLLLYRAQEDRETFWTCPLMKQPFWLLLSSYTPHPGGVPTAGLRRSHGETPLWSARLSEIELLAEQLLHSALCLCLLGLCTYAGRRSWGETAAHTPWIIGLPVLVPPSTEFPNAQLLFPQAANLIGSMQPYQ